MFGLKLPSELKKGAAEEEHSIKKARGEVLVPHDPEAGLVWKKNKGGPVWGVKEAPPPEKEKEPIKFKPAWSLQPPPVVHSIADDQALAKAKAENQQTPGAQENPPEKKRAWAVLPSPTPPKGWEEEGGRLPMRKQKTRYLF